MVEHWDLHQEAHSYFHAHAAYKHICLTLKKLFILPIFQLPRWCCHAEPCCFFEDWGIDRPDESFTGKEIQIQSIPQRAVGFDKRTRSREINVNMRWKCVLDSSFSEVEYFFMQVLSLTARFNNNNKIHKNGICSVTLAPCLHKPTPTQPYAFRWGFIWLTAFRHFL